MARPRIFRRQFLIYPHFQMTLIIFNSLVLFAMAVLVGFAAKTAFTRLAQVGMQIHLYANHPFYTLITNNTHHFYGFLVLTLVGALVISNGIIIFFTHKIAGPIIHLEHYFKTIVRRERAPRRQLRFREGDYFYGLPSAINGAVSILRTGVSEDSLTISRIRRPRA